jgi:hypothetical protein
MSAPSPTALPPISSVIITPSQTSYSGWLTWQLQGVNCPGTIQRGGVRGFKRETGWDIKKGKGTAGATLTLRTLPPVEGTITNQLVTQEDFAAWDTFVEQVLSISVASQQAEGLSIYYPQFSSIGLRTVVVKDYVGPEHQGKGLYHVSVSLIEWFPPPAVSVVATVSTTAQDEDVENDNAPEAVNPQIAALQAQIAQVSQAVNAP